MRRYGQGNPTNSTMSFTVQLSSETSNEFQASIPNASHYARLYLFQKSLKPIRSCFHHPRKIDFLSSQPGGRMPIFSMSCDLNPLSPCLGCANSHDDHTLSRPHIASSLPLSPLFVVYEICYDLACSFLIKIHPSRSSIIRCSLHTPLTLEQLSWLSWQWA